MRSHQTSHHFFRGSLVWLFVAACTVLVACVEEDPAESVRSAYEITGQSDGAWLAFAGIVRRTDSCTLARQAARAGTEAARDLPFTATGECIDLLVLQPSDAAPATVILDLDGSCIELDQCDFPADVFTEVWLELERSIEMTGIGTSPRDEDDKSEGELQTTGIGTSPIVMTGIGTSPIVVTGIGTSPRDEDDQPEGELQITGIGTSPIVMTGIGTSPIVVTGIGTSPRDEDDQPEDELQITGIGTSP